MAENVILIVHTVWPRRSNRSSRGDPSEAYPLTVRTSWMAPSGMPGWGWEFPSLYGSWAGKASA